MFDNFTLTNSYASSNETVSGIGPIVAWHTTETSESIIALCILLLIVTVVRILFANVPEQLPKIFEQKWYLWWVRWVLHFEKFVPESSMLIVLGVIIGGILKIPGWPVNRLLTFNSQFFFYTLVPPIMLDSGYFLQKNFFFSNLGLILTYAVIGTLLNALSTGFSLWGLDFSGLYNVNGQLANYTVFDFLMFGSLMSSVDPVAILAVFQEVEVNETLDILVFGESVLNDAVSVVLYHVFRSLKQIEQATTAAGQTFVFGATHALLSIVKFLYVNVGGVSVGSLFGLLCAFCTRFTENVPILEPLLVAIFAFLSYFLAESISTSGIMSILFCGIVMSRYVELNITKKSHTALKYILKMVASAAETLIFVYLGISLIHHPHVFDWSLIGFTLLFIELYRFVFTFSLTAIGNVLRKKENRISLKEQFIMFYGGLRGAIAFALAYEIPSNNFEQERNALITTTLFVVVFTIFVQGTTISPILRLLSVAKKQADSKKIENLRTEEMDFDLEEHEIAGYLDKFAYLEATIQDMPKSIPETIEFVNINKMLIEKIMRKLIQDVLQLTKKLEAANEDFKCKISDKNIEELQTQGAEGVKREWRSYLESLKNDYLMTAHQDMTNNIRYLRDHLFTTVQEKPQLSKEQNEDKELEDISKSEKISPFIDVCMRLDLVTVDSRGQYQIAYWAKDTTYLYYLLRVCQVDALKLWIKRAKFAVECQDLQDCKLLVHILLFFISKQHSTKQEELRIMKKMEFADQILTAGFSHIREGFKAVVGNYSFSYRLKIYLKRIDKLIQKICVRKLGPKERELLFALASLKKATQMEQDAKDIQNAQLAVMDASNKYVSKVEALKVLEQYHHRVNMDRLVKLGIPSDYTWAPVKRRPKKSTREKHGTKKNIEEVFVEVELVPSQPRINNRETREQLKKTRYGREDFDADLLDLERYLEDLKRLNNMYKHKSAGIIKHLRKPKEATPSKTIVEQKSPKKKESVNTEDTESITHEHEFQGTRVDIDEIDIGSNDIDSDISGL